MECGDRGYLNAIVLAALTRITALNSLLAIKALNCINFSSCHRLVMLPVTLCICMYVQEMAASDLNKVWTIILKYNMF